MRGLILGLALLGVACGGKAEKATTGEGGNAGASGRYEGDGTFTCPEYADNEGFVETRELTGPCSVQGQVCEFSGPAICPPGSTFFPQVKYRCECAHAAWSCASDGASHSVCSGAPGLAACSDQKEKAFVDGTFALSCLPETFEMDATLTLLEMGPNPNTVLNATFTPEVPMEQPGCGVSTINYRGLLPPSLTIGAQYHLRGQFITRSQVPQGAVSLRDTNGELLVGWYSQSTDFLNQTDVTAGLGYEFSAKPACQVDSDCFALEAENSLQLTNESEIAILSIGDVHVFERKGSHFTIGLNGGSSRAALPVPRCTDVSAGDDVVFTVVVGVAGVRP
jgi:hypothetical protein